MSPNRIRAYAEGPPRLAAMLVHSAQASCLPTHVRLGRRVLRTLVGTHMSKYRHEVLSMWLDE